MATVQPIRQRRATPIPMHAHAMDDLRYIRETMERAGSFTAVPGWGGVAMGASAVLASLIAAHRTSSRAWLATWLAEGALAVAIGILAMCRKASAAGLPIWSPPTRKFVFSFMPPLVVGAALYGGAVAGGLGYGHSGRLADAARHGRDHRRSIFGAGGSRHGCVLPGCRGARHVPFPGFGPGVEPRALERRMAWPGLRRSTYSIRSDHREEVRWLDTTLFLWNMPLARPRSTSRRLGRESRIWTG